MSTKTYEFILQEKDDEIFISNALKYYDENVVLIAINNYTASIQQAISQNNYPEVDKCLTHLNRYNEQHKLYETISKFSPFEYGRNNISSQPRIEFLSQSIEMYFSLLNEKMSKLKSYGNVAEISILVNEIVAISYYHGVLNTLFH